MTLPGTELPEGQVVYGWRRVRPVDTTDPDYIPAVAPIPAEAEEDENA